MSSALPLEAKTRLTRINGTVCDQHLVLTSMFGILQMLKRTRNSGSEVKNNPGTQQFKYSTFHLLCYYITDYSLLLHNTSKWRDSLHATKCKTTASFWIKINFLHLFELMDLKVGPPHVHSNPDVL